MQFLSENFIFDGITSKDIGVELITFDDEIIKDFGNIFSQEITSEGNLNNKPFYSTSFSELEDTVLNVMLIDKITKLQKVWTPLDVQRVVNWLVVDSFRPFISEDNLNIVYYFKCTNINKRFTTDGTGYLECTFKMFGNYAYEMFEFNTTVSGNSSIKIINSTNLDGVYKPILKITNLGNTSTVNKISVNGKTLEIQGLNTNETLTIDNEMCSVFDELDNNRIENVNRKWIELIPGDNNLTLSGNFRVELFAEFPIIM